jgi:hypothetical protein
MSFLRRFHRYVDRVCSDMSVPIVRNQMGAIRSNLDFHLRAAELPDTDITEFGGYLSYFREISAIAQR